MSSGRSARISLSSPSTSSLFCASSASESSPSGSGSAIRATLSIIHHKLHTSYAQDKSLAHRAAGAGVASAPFALFVCAGVPASGAVEPEGAGSLEDIVQKYGAAARSLRRVSREAACDITLEVGRKEAFLIRRIRRFA